MAAAATRAEVAEWTINRWREQFGGMNPGGAKRSTELEKENARLKELLAEKELDSSILKEAVEGRDGRPRGNDRPYGTSPGRSG